MAINVVRDCCGRPFPTYLDHIPPGWRALVKGLAADLFELGWGGQINQLKEKFGGLRFYISEGSSQIYDRIEKAEQDSYSICQLCGASGRGRVKETGWIVTLCRKHADELRCKDLEEDLNVPCSA